MANQEGKCPYSPIGESAQDYLTCKHPLYKNHGFCIFHSTRVEEKEADFQPTLNELITRTEDDDNIGVHNFVGFIFPPITLEYHFIKSASFRKAQFSGTADFRKVQFSDYANFGNTQFLDDADFRKAQFLDNADFLKASFSGYAYFGEASFLGYVNFYGTQFSGDANFRKAQFSGTTDFRKTQFSDWADFKGARFSGKTDFREASFKKVSDFSGAAFYNILLCNESHLRLVNKIEAMGINFDGAVIEEANLWGIKELDGYSFRNSFLLSISFAEKELTDCDFTGAVIDAVRTRGWKLTGDKTEYIYTDYTTETEVDPDTGHEKTVYQPVEDSRVPASGGFGQGENVGFDLAFYLKERYKWSRSVPVPPTVRTAVLNYIQFFTDFIRVTQGLNVEIHTKQEGERIRVEFFTDTKEEKEQIASLFKEYLQKAKEKTDTLQVTISEHSKATPMEREILIIDLKNQINTLQTKFEYTERLLLSEKEKIQILYDVKAFRTRLESPESLLEDPASKKTERKDTLCVLKADIKGFSGLMEKGRGGEISNKVEAIVKHAAVHCRQFKTGEGDAVQIVHHDPQHLAKTAFRIMEDLLEHPEQPIFRMAIDCGEITYEEQDGKITKLLSGSPLRTAARIEPCVKPGEIWVTEPVKALLDHKGGKYKAVEIRSEDVAHLESKNGKFNIKKAGSTEADFYMKLYRLTDNA